jgi:hypothetical protein
MGAARINLLSPGTMRCRGGPEKMTMRGGYGNEQLRMWEPGGRRQQGPGKIRGQNSQMVVYLNSAVLGRGDDELGGNPLAIYLDTLGDFARDISHVILVNSGVKLACNGSPVLEAGESGRNRNQDHLLRDLP